MADLSRGLLRRNVAYALPPPHQALPVPAPYGHQVQTLLRLEQGAGLAPPLSGIVHLPTGAGKTRVALEHIARTLAQDPDHRFIWATHSKLLLRQTMARVLEFAARLPRGLHIAWHDGSDRQLLAYDLHVSFMTRFRLTEELAKAPLKKLHPWRARLQAGRPLTLIYDECHQLGAPELQRQLDRFYDKVVAPIAPQARWRVIGLSATPLPTRSASRWLLSQTLFPLRHEAQSVERGWGMHVFHRVTNEELIREGVICPVNMHLDRTGIFDIPPELLRRIVGETGVQAPGPNARKDEVMEYALAFNGAVMSHPEIVEFFAGKLARNIETLGKTIVFVPNIDTANRLVAALSRFPSCAGRVAAVHSRMSELAHAVVGQEGRTPQEVLTAFKARGAQPCILVNVEMLTEGFDDPKVRAVVLAKLTLSTNRFWQMIGRGTRGPKAGGTADCFVIDPIKLVRLYDYFGGYQPTVESRPGHALEDEAEERGDGALAPNVPVVSRPPLPSAARYEISPELRATHAQVALAIEAFLGGAKLTEEQAVEIGRTVRICSADGAVVALLGSGPQTAETGPLLLREAVVRMAARMKADLGWLERRLPGATTDDILRYFTRKLDAIEALELRTEDDFVKAEMDGRLLRFLSPSVSSEPQPAA